MFRFNLSIRAESPIAHSAFGESTGNVTCFRREDIALSDTVIRVPAISGGAIRGVMRRLVMREMLDACGLSRESLQHRDWDRLYGALVNGGTLDGSEGRVDPAAIRALRLAIPPLSLFGAALYSRMMAGRMSVGWARLDCQELGTGPLLMADLVQEIGAVRHVDREEYDVVEAGMTPMPVTTECVISGATLRSTISVRGTPLEAGVAARGIELIQHLGGKGASGLGSVSIAADGPVTGEAWVRHLADHREQIGASLCALAAEVGAKPKKGKAA